MLRAQQLLSRFLMPPVPQELFLEMCLEAVRAQPSICKLQGHEDHDDRVGGMVLVESRRFFYYIHKPPAPPSPLQFWCRFQCRLGTSHRRNIRGKRLGWMTREASFVLSSSAVSEASISFSYRGACYLAALLSSGMAVLCDLCLPAVSPSLPPKILDSRRTNFV